VDNYASSSEDEGELDEQHILGKPTAASRDVSFKSFQLFWLYLSHIL